MSDFLNVIAALAISITVSGFITLAAMLAIHVTVVLDKRGGKND